MSPGCGRGLAARGEPLRAPTSPAASCWSAPPENGPSWPRAWASDCPASSSSPESTAKSCSMAPRACLVARMRPWAWGLIATLHSAPAAAKANSSCSSVRPATPRPLAAHSSPPVSPSGPASAGLKRHTRSASATTPPASTTAARFASFPKAKDSSARHASRAPAPRPSVSRRLTRTGAAPSSRATARLRLLPVTSVHSAAAASAAST
mmetsp:Transcript_59666/g.135008  ORF Transcript_59666/g.135008 Transcript_59666/m.135008 type:complete len:208 (-) Transcript_59666:560-1183(-)